MDFGVVLQTNPPASRTVQLAKLAEAARLQPRVDVRLAPAVAGAVRHLQPILAETKRVMVGPFVTNPATRDWTVTASVFATLNEMYGNRTICGIGRGDSAVRVTNGKPIDAGRAARVDPRHPRARATRRPVEYNGAHAAVPVEPRLASSRSGSPPTVRWRSSSRARWATASSCSSPTSTSPRG